MAKPGYCDMRGMLSFHLLWLLRKGDRCGEDLAKELEARRGERPNPGTIYPALKSLANAGLIESSKKDRRVFYKLTYEGRMELDVATGYFKQVFGEIVDSSLAPAAISAVSGDGEDVVAEEASEKAIAEEASEKMPSSEKSENVAEEAVEKTEPAEEGRTESAGEAVEKPKEPEAPIFQEVKKGSTGGKTEETEEEEEESIDEEDIDVGPGESEPEEGPEEEEAIERKDDLGIDYI